MVRRVVAAISVVFALLACENGAPEPDRASEGGTHSISNTGGVPPRGGSGESRSGAGGAVQTGGTGTSTLTGGAGNTSTSGVAGMPTIGAGGTSVGGTSAAGTSAAGMSAAGTSAAGTPMGGADGDSLGGAGAPPNGGSGTRALPDPDYEVDPDSLVDCRGPDEPECDECCYQLGSNCIFRNGETEYNDTRSENGDCPDSCSPCASCYRAREDHVRELLEELERTPDCDCTTQWIGTDPCFGPGCQCTCAQLESGLADCPPAN
jgi:hypothetical protein